MTTRIFKTEEFTTDLRDIVCIYRKSCFTNTKPHGIVIVYKNNDEIIKNKEKEVYNEITNQWREYVTKYLL